MTLTCCCLIGNFVGCILSRSNTEAQVCRLFPRRASRILRFPSLWAKASSSSEVSETTSVCGQTVDRIKNSFHREGLSPKLVTPEWLRNNSGFIIVHSVENFDFGMKDGIAMYEWNTFRNLLKGEMIKLT